MKVLYVHECVLDGRDGAHPGHTHVLKNELRLRRVVYGAIGPHVHYSKFI
jgi:hypothetical protein